MRLLIDIDGTLVDTHALALERGLIDHHPCRWDFDRCCTTNSLDDVFGSPGLFLDAPEIPGAIEAVRRLMERFDVWLVSAPWASNPASSAEKHKWATRHGWERRLVLAHDKSIVAGDALIDDRPDLVGPWRHWTYPQAWNTSTLPTWAGGLADVIIEDYAGRKL